MQKSATAAATKVLNERKAKQEVGVQIMASVWKELAAGSLKEVCRSTCITRFTLISAACLTVEDIPCLSNIYSADFGKECTAKFVR